jgi:phospholipase/lecithinase/hemolysin
MKNLLKSASRSATLATLLAASTLTVTGAASAGDEQFHSNPELIVFGDSLSDSGNFYINTGEYSVQPFELVPSAPYALGGFHFTNGHTWVEILASLMRDLPSGGPALRRPGRFTNYAYGTARSRPGTTGLDLGDQVGMFLSDFGGQAPREAVYVMWTGGNDVRDALGALQLDPTGATSVGILQAAIAATADSIVALNGSGARVFLVLNAPNIAVTPVVRALGADAQVAALQLTMLYNQGLSQAIGNLAVLPGIDIEQLDVFHILGQLIEDPESYGFVNVTEACIAPATINGAICDRPNDYLFWDGIHPTRAGHRFLANAAMIELSASDRNSASN